MSRQSILMESVSNKSSKLSHLHIYLINTLTPLISHLFSVRIFFMMLDIFKTHLDDTPYPVKAYHYPLNPTNVSTHQFVHTSRISCYIISPTSIPQPLQVISFHFTMMNDQQRKYVHLLRSQMCQARVIGKKNL